MLLLSAINLNAAPLKVVMPHWGANSDQQNTYFYQVLALAFAKTESRYGPVELQVYPENLTSARLMADLKQNVTIDVIWTGTTPQREKDFLPIRISLLKELNEYRVLLIRREDQEKFSRVNSVEDLRKFTAGSGTDWPSREVLQHNQLPVITVTNADLLFPMLKAKRFDYISRNMFEVWGEAKTYEKDGLAMEKTLLLHGGVPFYFFVNKNNFLLAERIEQGLKMATADGSFAKLFFSFPDFKRGSDEIKSTQRKNLLLGS